MLSPRIIDEVGTKSSQPTIGSQEQTNEKTHMLTSATLKNANASLNKDSEGTLNNNDLLID